MNQAALLAFVEAAYALELDDRSWLSEVVHATLTLVGPEHGYVGFFYDAAQVESLNVWNVCALDPRAEQPQLVEHERAVWSDVFELNGLVTDGVGCAVMVGTDAYEFSPPAEQLATYERLARHLAVAFRSRRRLGVSQVPHGPELAGADAASAIAAGYLVARENPARATHVQALTAREREIVLQAALGLSNKQIGRALGISDSTVRVLIARAIGKMGVRSRAELLSLPPFRAESRPH